MVNATAELRRALWAGLAVLCLIAPARAVENLIGRVLEGSVSKAPMTAAEVKAMHPACITIGMGRINGEFWAAAINKEGARHLLNLPENDMARDAPWFHHYCWGMLGKLRYLSAKNKQDRSHELTVWRDNMVFIIDWTARERLNWRYLPLIQRELAEAHLAGMNYGHAILAAERALSLNPKQVDAYWIMADSYQAMNNPRKALDTVTEGLRQVPNAKPLTRRYKELGGKLPHPEPYPAAPSPALPPAKPEPVTRQDTVARQAPPAPATATTPLPADAAPPPSNAAKPYCRFCP